MNNAIDDEVSRYMDFNKSDMRGNDNISYCLFLELLLLRETIKYSTNNKRNYRRKRKN